MHAVASVTHRHPNAAQRQWLSTASLLALFPCVTVIGPQAGAQTLMTFGPGQYNVERPVGATGQAGEDNNGKPTCNGTSPGGAGAGGGAITRILSYTPAGDETFVGDIAVVGSTGGKGGTDIHDSGCTYNGGAGGVGGAIALKINGDDSVPEGGYLIGNTAIAANSHGGVGGNTSDKELKGGDGGSGGRGYGGGGGFGGMGATSRSTTAAA